MAKEGSKRVEICVIDDKRQLTVKNPVDLRLSIVKPLSAKWFVQLSDYFKAHPEIIKNGFKGACITYEMLVE